MFTGIIEAVGTVQRIQTQSGDLRLTVNSGALDMVDVDLGDSIATQGICLTVVECFSQAFVADVSVETVRHTTIMHWRTGTLLNLEKAVQPMSRLGGHLVSGHVDGVGEIVRSALSARALSFTVQAPEPLMRYIALKGSITVDGISLTVNALHPQGFDLTLVPHTAGQTTVQDWKTGALVNLEVDMVARYLERLLQKPSQESSVRTHLDQDFLARHGYL